MTDDKDKQPDSDFESRLQRALAPKAGGVTPDVAERLAAMRRNAVAQLDHRTGFGWGRAAFVTAFATVVLAAGVFLMFDDASVPAMPAADEPEFAAAQEMDVLVELEFLAWLEEEATDAG
jgi:hypothetical protein